MKAAFNFQVYTICLCKYQPIHAQSWLYLLVELTPRKVGWLLMTSHGDIKQCGWPAHKDMAQRQTKPFELPQRLHMLLQWVLKAMSIPVWALIATWPWHRPAHFNLNRLLIDQDARAVGVSKYWLIQLSRPGNQCQKLGPFCLISPSTRTIYSMDCTFVYLHQASGHVAVAYIKTLLRLVAIIDILLTH